MGKIIEVFRVGPWIYYNGSPLVTNQDIICLITNVANGTNLYMSIPAGWTSNSVYCVVGTNNAAAFQAAVNSASNSIASQAASNVTIQIPPGNYLLITSNALMPGYVMSSISDTEPAVVISTGGITFSGSAASNTVLMGCGAGMNHLVISNNMYPAGEAPYVPQRGNLFFCSAPVVHSQYPLVFENLTLDGGLPNGIQSYNYWTVNQANGDGWDMTHDALIDIDPTGANAQMHQLKVFTNCVFQHWRGEILKSVVGTGGTNTFIDIANCAFNDGNASAINFTFGHHVHGCTFTRLVKIEEFYESYAKLPTLFENNSCTNIISNVLSINGSTTNINSQPILIRNNQLNGLAGWNTIQFSPAENVTISNNTFGGGANCIVSTGAGLQPSDGSASIVTNIIVNGNSFLGNGLALYADGYPINGLWVSNNVGISAQFYGTKMNIRLYGNTAGGYIDSRQQTSGLYPIDYSNNQFSTYYQDGGNWVNPTNTVTYALGRRHLLSTLSTGIFLLDDTNALIPSGAILEITNTGQYYGNPVYICPSSKGPVTPIKVTNGQDLLFYWTNGSWQTNSTVSAIGAPINLHVVSGSQ